jgi:sugar phosphate isomerase/epimerase
VPLISLDHLTLFELTPPQLVEAAAASGFDHVGLRLNPAAPPGERQHPMLGDSPMRRETLARMRDTGVAVFDFGVFRLKQGVDLAAFEPVLESAAVLGAREAVVNGDDPDPQRLADLLRRLCELGRCYGVRMNLEPTPWTGIPTLGAAVAVIQACGDVDARLMVDTIHVDRSGGTLADLAALPHALIDYIQVCDAVGPRPRDLETMIYQARNERAYPGEGDLDLVGMLSMLPEDVPLSLEAPVKSLSATLDPVQRARRARERMASLVAAVVARRKASAISGESQRPRSDGRG